MSFDDELQRSLHGLETDLYAAKMPGASAARKRAAQRTRTKVVGTVLGGVAAVAAGAVIVLQPFMPAANEAPPATTDPTPTESETQEPTQEPTEAVPERIPDAAMMTAEELLDDIEDNRGWEPTDAPDPSSGPSNCVPDVGAVEGLDNKRVDYEHVIEGASENAVARHEVHRAFPDTGEQRFNSLRDAIESCVPTNERDDEVGWSPYYVDKSSGEGVGDESWLIRYFVENTDDEVLDRLITITLVRSGDVVSMTVRQEPQNEAHTVPDTFTPIHVTERVCLELLDTSCVDEPDFPDLADYEESSGDPASGEGDDPIELSNTPFLTEDQLNPVGYPGYFSDEPPVQNVAPAEAWCLDDPGFVGAEALDYYWGSDVEGYIGEAVLQFPDAVSAAEWFDDYTSIVARCAAMGVEVVTGDNAGPREINQLTIDLDNGNEALGWEILGHGGGETGTYFLGAAVATRGNIGIIMTFSAISPPDDWAGYVTEKLPLALDHAIE